jgi:hypothetical protein
VATDSGGHGACTVIRMVSTTAQFDTCTIVSVNGTLVEDKMRNIQG